MNKIGERLKIVRKKNKLSQEVFSERIGLSRSFIANAEKDRYNLTTEHIFRISNIFGINAHWLLTGEGEMTGGADKDMTERIEPFGKPKQPEIIPLYNKVEDNRIGLKEIIAKLADLAIRATDADAQSEIYGVIGRLAIKAEGVQPPELQKKIA